MSKQAVKSNSRIKLFFDYDFELKEYIKYNLLGVQYVPENKCWICSTCLTNLDKIIDLGFSLDEDLEKIYYQLKNLNNANSNTKCNIEIKAPAGLELMPFQIEGVKFLEQRNGNAIVADEMGLGKTITALTYVSIHPEIKPVVIVVPASLKYNWKKEAEKWIINKRNIEILSGKKNAKLDKKTADIIILNYDIASAWTNEIKRIKPQLVILDEAHMIKNTKSGRSKAVKKICSTVPHKLPLSGTPSINKPIELYEVIDMIEPNLFASRFEFGVKYCNGHHNGYGWDFSGASNLEDLYLTLKGMMLRRKKADVLKDLPDKRYSYVPLELSNSKEYYRAEKEFMSALKTDSSGISACNAEVLFQLAVSGALTDSINWIKQFIETGEEKLVVFATHRFVIDKLMDEFGKIAVKIDGSISTGQIRQDIVNQFQTDPSIRLFIGNIKAAGVGLTLTAASNVAFLELPWTPAELNQAIDRVHRISQKNAVNVWFLLADNTIEMRLAQILDKKQVILSKAIDGEDLKNENTLLALINSYRE